MPALRQNHPALLPRNRRRSSVFTPAKAGLYTVGGMLPPSSNNQHQHDDDASPPTSLSQLPPRPISFAPNVTPITFIESDDSLSSPEDNSPGMFGDAGSQARLFPPSEGPVQPPTRKRQPPGKRRSQGYIPRPPNAFMLFRADFVRQKHVPGSIETNHGSLSKIIGNCWRNLPLEEKKVWETRAKHEKAAHKVQYPNYRFKPVHKKKGALAAAAAPSLADADAASETSSSRGGIPSNAPSHPSHLNASHGGTAISGSYHPSNTHLLKDEFKKPKAQPTEEEELRCEQMTQLLLEGKKGEELAMAMKSLDDRRRAAKARENAARFESTAPSFAGMRKYSMTPGPLMLSSGRGSMSFGAGNGLGGIMSAPQPTYPQQSPFAPGPLHMNGMDPTFFNSNDNGNAAAGNYLHLRRSSSVPLPGAYGFEGGFFGAIEDYYMGMEMDGMVAPPYSEVDVHQHQQQQQGNPTAMEVHTLLPPPPSGGLTGIANSSLNSSGLPSAAPTTGDSTFGGFNMGGGGFTQRLSISRHRAMLGHRRSSSAGPAFGGIARQHQQQWAAAAAAGVPYDGFAGFGNFSMGGADERGPVVLQRDDSPLPEPDVSLFNPSFLSGGGSAGNGGGHHSRAVSMGMMDTAVDPMAPIAPSSNMVGPLAPLDPAAMGPLDPTAMGPLDGYAGDMISPSAGGAEYGGWNPDVNVGPNDAFNNANNMGPTDPFANTNDSYANVSPNESYANDAYSHPASSEPSPAPSYTQEYYSPNDGYAGQQEVYQQQQQQHEYAQQQPEAVYAPHQQQQQQGYAYGPFVEC